MTIQDWIDETHEVPDPWGLVLYMSEDALLTATLVATVVNAERLSGDLTVGTVGVPN